MMGVDSETAWHSFVKKNYSHLFPHLCCRSRYRRRKKNLYLLTELLRAKLEKEIDVGLCENYIADSYPLPVCTFGRANFCKSFRYEETAYGRCPSPKNYYGYKIHVLTTIDGYISRYILGKANEDDREGLYHLTEGLYGITILGDKGYSGRAIREAMAEQGITLHALKPSHHKDHWVKHFRHIIFRFRRKIETVFTQLTCQMNGEQVLARSFNVYLSLRYSRLYLNRGFVEDENNLRLFEYNTEFPLRTHLHISHLRRKSATESLNTLRRDCHERWNLLEMRFKRVTFSG